MSLVTVTVDDSDSQRVISGTICQPRIGVWHLDLKVDTDLEIQEDSPATVSINGGELDLVGTVTRAIEYQGVTQMRVVAGDATADETGARGMQRLAKPRFYSKPTVGAVLADLAANCGNTLSDDCDADITGSALNSWTTIAAPIGRQIAELLRPIEGAVWRMLPDGTLWVGAETWPETSIAEEDWQTIEYDHWNGVIHFGLLSPTLLPGTTIGGYRADRVEMTISGDSVTATAWEPRDDGARIDRDFAALGRGSTRPFDFYAFYAGKTSAQADQTFDIQPDDARLPAMSGVPVRHGVPGMTVQLPAESNILVGWRNGDPREPFCALWGGGEMPTVVTFGADKIQLGADGLVAAQHGLVLAKCVDPFTGLPHYSLQGTSASVMAKE